MRIWADMAEAFWCLEVTNPEEWFWVIAHVPYMGVVYIHLCMNGGFL